MDSDRESSEDDAPPNTVGPFSFRRDHQFRPPPPDVVDVLEQDLVDGRCGSETPRIAEQPSRRTQLDSDDEPLATAVVAGSRANSPGLAAFDLTVDDSDSNTVLELATYQHAEDVHDQLSMEEGGHSIVIAFDGVDVNTSCYAQQICTFD